MGHLSHILCHERGGVAIAGSIFPRVIQNQPDGTLDLETIKLNLPVFSDPHVNRIASIALESSQNNCSGRVLRMDYINKVRSLADEHGIKMTLDGARSWNASVFLGIPMAEMVRPFDLVSVCFSKGMGCPVGSFVVGSGEDIQKAINYRKILGGAMRQIGVGAACGLIALKNWQERISKDNENAAFMAAELADIPGVRIDPSIVETNILRFTFEPETQARMGLDYRDFSLKLKEEHDVLCNAGFNNEYIRFVTHRDVSREMCERAIKAVRTMTQ